MGLLEDSVNENLKTMELYLIRDEMYIEWCVSVGQ